MLSRLSRVPQDVVGLFESLVHSPDPVFATDRHLNVIFWNLSCERLFGFNDEEIVGSSCANALGGCDAFGNRYCSEHCPVTQMEARGETIRHFGLRLRAKDGRMIPMDVSVLHLAVARGQARAAGAGFSAWSQVARAGSPAGSCTQTACSAALTRATTSVWWPVRFHSASRLPMRSRERRLRS